MTTYTQKAHLEAK